MTQSEAEASSSAKSSSKRSRLGLGGQVLIGLVLGLALGIFLGEMAGSLQIVGDAFIMLLQITVIPYIMVSLITALGRLTLDEARSLGLKAGGVLLLLWGVGVAAVLLTPLAFPEWPSASFFSTSQVEKTKPVDFLQLYIPANPFYSLANAVVPAIVLFSVLIGLALTGVENKESLLVPLSAVADALMGVTGFIAKLAPYGVFALTASAAGTLDIEELQRLQVYVVTYVAIALILSLWLLPGLITTLAPIRYGDIIRAFRGPLITAFATGNVLIVLPLLAAYSKELLGQGAGSTKQTGTESSVDVLIPAAYNFPNLGAVLSLMFLLFAGWYIGISVRVSQYPELVGSGLASLFGGTILAIPFLLDLLELPQDLFQIFVTVDVLGSRFGTLLAAMHIGAIALIGTLALEGRATVRFVPLVRFAGITAVLLAVTLIGIRAFYTYVVVAPYTKDQALKGKHLLVDPQPAVVYSEVPPDLKEAGDIPTSLAQIQQRGALRVCYLPDDYPAAFNNDETPPDLVGFDIEMAHRFAQSLQLPINFLPVGGEDDAARLLNAGTCDLFASGIVISALKTQRFALTAPIYTSSVGLIVKDHERNRFQTWEDIRGLGGSLRVAVSDAPEDRVLVDSLTPDAKVLPISSLNDQRKKFESGFPDVDAIGSFSEHGAAWTVLYPDFTLVVPRPPVFLPVGYAVAPNNEKLLEAFNAWLVAEKRKGTIDALYEHWMLGKTARGEKPPRWSVIRDVLGWVN